MSLVGMYWSVIYLVLISATQRVTSTREYKLGVLLPYTGTPEYPMADRYASAITLAIENVNKDPTLLNGAKLSFVWNDTACNQSKMVEQQHWQIHQGVVGFVGPSCHGRKAAKIAEKKDLALISYDSQDSHLSNKKMFPNVARTNPQYSNAALETIKLAKTRGWTRVNIVYENKKKWVSLKRFLTQLLKRQGIAVGSQIKVHWFLVAPSIPDIKDSIDFKTQATIFLTSFGKAKEILRNLEDIFERNPSPSYSSHLFVSVPLDRLSMNLCAKLPFKWFFSSYVETTEKIMAQTKRAFEKLLIVSNVPHHETRQFKMFEKILKRKTSQAPWFSNAYQGCLKIRDSCFFNKSDTKITLKAVYLYDAVIQFARGLDEVLGAGEKPTGENIIAKLKNTHFIGADGHQHTFDNNADVLYHYTVLGLRRDKNGQLNMLPMESNRISYN